MSENMVDVLIYLYENYMDGESPPPTDQGDLERELAEAGFSQTEITHALRWLDELADGVDTPQYHAHTVGAIRVYSDHECAKLDAEVRGLLLSLEQHGILDPISRELAIDRLLAINHASIMIDEAKWVVLLVLMNRPGREDAFNLMEDIVYHDEQVYLH